MAVNKDKVKPQIWLTIYGIIMFALLIVFALSWDSVSKHTKDLSYAIRQEHVTATGETKNVRYSRGRTPSQLCTIDNENFNITRSVFCDVRDGDIYTIAYLPNTKYFSAIRLPNFSINLSSDA